MRLDFFVPLSTTPSFNLNLPPPPPASSSFNNLAKKEREREARTDRQEKNTVFLNSLRSLCFSLPTRECCITSCVHYTARWRACSLISFSCMELEIKLPRSLPTLDSSCFSWRAHYSGADLRFPGSGSGRYQILWLAREGAMLWLRVQGIRGKQLRPRLCILLSQVPRDTYYYLLCAIKCEL